MTVEDKSKGCNFFAHRRWMQVLSHVCGAKMVLCSLWSCARSTTGGLVELRDETLGQKLDASKNVDGLPRWDGKLS